MALYDALPDVVTTDFLIQRFERFSACISPGTCSAPIIHELASAVVVKLKAFKEQEESLSPDREDLYQREAEITVDMLAIERIMARYRFEAEMALASLN